MKRTALILTLFLFACDGEATEAPAGGDAAPKTEAPAPDAAPAGKAAPAGNPAPAMEAPTLDAGMDICFGPVDCEAVQLSCCSSCDGGLVVAVNKSRAEEVKTKFGQKDCDQYSCGDGECATPEVACNGGCKIKAAG